MKKLLLNIKNSVLSKVTFGDNSPVESEEVEEVTYKHIPEVSRIVEEAMFQIATSIGDERMGTFTSILEMEEAGYLQVKYRPTTEDVIVCWPRTEKHPYQETVLPEEEADLWFLYRRNIYSPRTSRKLTKELYGTEPENVTAPA